ncbi:MAG: hypothetical protein IAE81_18410 [Caldilineaceae bacterium]|jgi:hypothetical protein|nr:hypothetical protein [Caldilineaceae bacterium]
MKQSTRWFLIALVGLLLLVGPTALRFTQPSAPPAAYTPPAIATAEIAATPIPTATPAQLKTGADVATNPVRRGPVIVDLAHYSAVERNRFQPMASALAAAGVDLRFWLPTVALDEVASFADFPDQSEALQKMLADASALIVISPFFLYNDAEAQIVERFLLDGGRLLVISDPDIEGDAARDTNSLASRFNVVFNEDYLYDTVENDANFTHFFQGGFFDQALALEGSRIVFYGGRSIDGAVTPQVRSASTTLSSLRTGQSGFTTVALGGLSANDTDGRVLALSDFDALTDPYVARYDNRRMLDFVVGFLAEGARNQTIADFPEFLGKQVALIVESNDPVGADAVSKAAELQRVLELSGRTLQLGATTWLTESNTAGDADLIYMAQFEDASHSTTLLSDMGFTLEERTITPTVTAPATTPRTDTTPLLPEALPDLAPDAESPSGTATPLPELPSLTPTPNEPIPSPLPESLSLTLLPAPDHAVVQNSTPTPTGAPPAETPAAQTPDASDAAIQPEAEETAEAEKAEETEERQPTPTVQVYLVRGDGIRLLADETQLFIQRTEESGRKTIAVLGADRGALNAGLTRLLNRDLAGCLIQDKLVICPYLPGAPAANEAAVEATAPTTAPRGIVPDKAPDGMPQDDPDALILIVDDDRNAVAGDVGEAELYAALLARAGYRPTLWSTQQSGYPEADILSNFAWIIWSDAAYSDSGVRGDALRIVGDLINTGGKLTLGSRNPFFGVGIDPASSIADVIAADGLPELVANLPTTPIVLADGLPDVTPLERNPEPSTGAAIALRRGPASAAADAPVLMLYTDENFDEPKGAKLLIFGMSINWLPDDVAAQLVENMARVMLAE